jgi:hypothetical protein
VRREAIGVTLIAALAVVPPARAQITPATPTLIASGLGSVTLGGLSVARDGTGGLVYTAGTGAAAHVYLSRLIGGSFTAPVALDAGLPGGSSEPVVAAGNDGLLLLAFVNAGTVYVTEVSSATGVPGPPQPVGPGPGHPSLSLNNFGVGYLAFTAADGAGDDVVIDYWNGSSWSAASPQAVNLTPGDAAGTGSGAPSVVAAGDGVGIVAWGENGHVYARRIWGNQTSTEVSQLDPLGLGGWAETSAGSPEVAAGGDSSYPDIAFAEHLTNGTQTQTRVLVARMIAETTVPAQPVDSLSTPGAEGATDPEIAMNEYGRGFVTAATDRSHRVIATPLFTNGVIGQPNVLDGAGELSDPFPEPGLAGLTSTDIVWQSTSAGVVGTPAQIVMAYAQDGVDLAAPIVLSSPTNGPTDAQDGLLTAGDTFGDAAAAWVQGIGPFSVYTDQLYQPPGQPQVAGGVSYRNTATPTLTWGPAREAWGPLSYTVLLDGSGVAQTQGTSLQTGPLTDGPHTFTVSAANPAGETSTSRTATVFIDTYPPRLRIRLTGRMRTRAVLRLTVAAFDTPNPTQPGARASGIARVTVLWGDGTRAVNATRRGRLAHAYRLRGLYRLRVTATDRAGNVTSVTHYVRIVR